MKKRSTKMMHRAIDGETSASETRILRRQLQVDEHARSAFQQLEQVVKETTRIRIQVPVDFRTKVMRGVEEETKRLRRKR